MLEWYKETVKDTAMMGPTRFASVIQKAKKIALEHPDPKMYNILLILTDGDIHDLKETIAEIAAISAENVPLSIIIVGLGDDEFINMVRLDGDDIAVKAGARDLVQFVKFNEVVKRAPAGQAMAMLAGMLLEEVPDQFVQHYTEKGVFPS